MNRLKFLATFFTGLFAAAQTRITPNNLKVNEPATVPPDINLWGATGDSFFTRIVIGPGFIIRKNNGKTELVAVNNTVTQIPLTRQSETAYIGIPLNTNPIVYYNGLFQTPGVDYIQLGNTVTFVSNIEPTAVITAVVIGG
jgi:hypothetical protein